MNEAVFSGAEIEVMREGFDVLVKEGPMRQEHLARLVMRAAQEHGASNSAKVIKQVQIIMREHAEQRGSS